MMRRRTFVTGTILGAAATAAAVWRARTGWAFGARGEADAAPGQLMPDGRRLVREAGLAFGTTVSIAAVHHDARAALAAARAALAQVRLVDSLMTVYRPGSQVGRLNATGQLGDRVALLVRGGDVEKDDLVGAFLVRELQVEALRHSKVYLVCHQ